MQFTCTVHRNTLIMFNGVIYWVKLGSNGISYNSNGTGSKDFVLKSKVVKHKQEECSGRHFI